MKKLLAIGVLALATTQAYAWGPREQGIVTGIAGTLLWQHVTQPRVVQAPPVVVQQAPQVVVPQSRVYSLPAPRPIYEERTQWDYNCNCYVRIYNQIGWE
jgi:hypothetical protein